MRAGGFSFRPSFEGELAAREIPDDFFERIERRLASGLFVAGSRRRANYLVTAKSSDALSFEAQGFLTAYAIGLNHVVLRRIARGVVSYQVSLARWTRYAVIHCGLLGLVLAVALSFPSAREQVFAHAYGPFLAYGMVAFWGGVWPWILTAVHRPFARRALERVLREELGAEPRQGQAA
jgi:hypothetical protein